MRCCVRRQSRDNPIRENRFFGRINFFFWFFYYYSWFFVFSFHHFHCHYDRKRPKHHWGLTHTLTVFMVINLTTTSSFKCYFDILMKNEMAQEKAKYNILER